MISFLWCAPLHPLRFGPMDNPSRSFWDRTSGNVVGLLLPHSTGMAWKHYPLKAEQTLHIAMWGQKAHYQHLDVWGGLITQKKATAPAGNVLDDLSCPGPRPTAGPEAAVHRAEPTPYNFSHRAQP